MRRASWSAAIPKAARPRLIWLLALALLLAARTAAAEPVAVRDDLGREVRLAAPARRIVALYGAFNEILDGMGLAERIAARTQADTLPASILDRPVIGTHMRPNVELIVALKPDLVLQMGGREEAQEPLRALEGFGLTTAFFQAEDFAGLFSVIERLGILTGEPARAAKLAAGLQARLAVVDAALAKVSRPRVFFEVRYPNLLAAGQASMVQDIIRRAGGENAVALDKKLVRLSEEEVFRLDPDVYVLQRGPMNPAPVPPARRPHFRELRAVREDRVFEVDEQVFSRPGPRNVEAVEQLANLLHQQLLREPKRP